MTEITRKTGFQKPGHRHKLPHCVLSVWLPLVKWKHFMNVD